MNARLGFGAFAFAAALSVGCNSVLGLKDDSVLGCDPATNVGECPGDSSVGDGEVGDVADTRRDSAPTSDTTDSTSDDADSTSADTRVPPPDTREAGPGETGSETATPDTAVLDTGTLDTGTLDTGTLDMGACEAGATETLPCGNCGTQMRTCVGGSWSTPTSCTGEGPCAPGATTSSACGNCGTEVDTCTASCTWSLGACTGTGECAAGSSRTVGCGTCGSEIDTCSASCTWTAGLCSPTGVCTPGATRAVACGNCGTETDTCSTSCGWTAGTCGGEGACAAGSIDTTSAGCPGIQVQSRTCSTSCAYGPYGACDYPLGWTAITPSTSVGLSARSNTGFVWSGSEMIVIGGYDGTSWLTDGGAYNPVTNTWRKLSTSPLIGYGDNVTVWAGDRVFLWGGAISAGVLYFPASDTWSSTGIATSPLSARRGANAVWSSATREVLVWGGYNGPATMFADGAAYNPATNVWRMLANAPIRGRTASSVVYSGGKMVLYGGICSFSPVAGCSDGAIYDPVADSWAALTIPAAITGARAEGASANVPLPSDRASFWGGAYNGSSWTNGFFVDPTTNLATSIPSPPTTVPLVDSSAVSFGEGSELCMYGMQSGPPGGGCYDEVAGSWTALPGGGPSWRGASAFVWTGSAFIVWGGAFGSSHLADGMILRR